MKQNQESKQDSDVQRLACVMRSSRPGLLHAAYSRFHRYSVRNQLFAMAQCSARKLSPGHPRCARCFWNPGS
jgi:hypothetical protein